MITRALWRTTHFIVAAVGAVALSGAAIALDPAFTMPGAERGLAALQDGAIQARPVAFSNDPTDLDFYGPKLDAPLPKESVKTVRLREGDTVMSLLLDVGVPKRRAGRIVDALAKHARLDRLRIGQEVVLYFSPAKGTSGRGALTGFALPLANGQSALAYRDFNNRFVATRLPTERAGALIRSIMLVEEDDSGEALISRDVVLGRGDTITGLLARADVSDADALRVSRVLGREVNLKKLRVGQTLRLTFTRAADGSKTAPRLVGLVLHRANRDDIVIQRQADGRFQRADQVAAAPEETVAEPASPETITPAPEVQPTAAAEDATEETAQTIVLRKGDTLYARLVALGASRRAAERAVRALDRIVKVKRLQIGQRAVARFAADGTGGNRLVAVELARAGKAPVIVGRQDNGRFKPGAPALSAVETVAAPAAQEPAAADVAQDVAKKDGQQAISATVRRGDTLAVLLRRAGVRSRDANAAIRSLSKLFKPSRIQPGYKLVVMTEDADGRTRMAGLVLQAGKKRAVIVAREESGRFSAQRAPLQALKDAATGARDIAAVVAAANAPKPDPLAGARAAALRRYADEAVRRETVTLGKGGTLMNAVVDAGANGQDAYAAIKAMRPLFNPRKIKAGQAVSLLFMGEEDAPRLVSMTLSTDPATRLEVVMLENKGFSAGLVARELNRSYYRAEGTIESSLYNAAVDGGMPIGVLMEMVRLFSFNVDFQRDIQKGDQFEVMFERFVDDDGTVVRDGAILYATMTMSGKEMPLYRYKHDNGDVDYYAADGKSVRNALMRTPIDGARLSSRFGMRKHPIAGYSKMHKGVDFAAPRGTPIYAAGNGTIERAERNGSYGNYIRIRHTGEYQTAYAHLSGFAPDIYPGARVAQGQVIGYVGSTGRSTGPHLHYEVLHNKRQVNPMSVKLPTGIRLEESELPRFFAERDRLREIYAALPVRTVVATGGN